MCTMYMMSLCDECVWRVCIMSTCVLVYNECIWWECAMSVYDECMWDECVKAWMVIVTCYSNVCWSMYACDAHLISVWECGGQVRQRCVCVVHTVSVRVMCDEYVRVFRIGVAALCVWYSKWASVVWWMCDECVRVWRAGVPVLCVSVW